MSLLPLLPHNSWWVWRELLNQAGPIRLFLSRSWNLGAALMDVFWGRDSLTPDAQVLATALPLAFTEAQLFNPFLKLNKFIIIIASVDFCYLSCGIGKYHVLLYLLALPCAPGSTCGISELEKGAPLGGQIRKCSFFSPGRHSPLPGWKVWPVECGVGFQALFHSFPWPGPFVQGINHITTHGDPAWPQFVSRLMCPLASRCHSEYETSFQTRFTRGVPAVALWDWRHLYSTRT